jgi:hypothetical protein
MQECRARSASAAARAQVHATLALAAAVLDAGQDARIARTLELIDELEDAWIVPAAAATLRAALGAEERS